MRFSITTNEIHRNASEMQELSARMTALLGKTDDLFKQMYEMWDSPVAKQCASTGLEQIKEGMKLVETMNQCAEIWKDVAARYEECEESIANEIASKLFL